MIFELSRALIAGFICGVVFSLIRLPIPAPPKLAGIIGIVGIFLGYILIEVIKKWRS